MNQNFIRGTFQELGVVQMKYHADKSALDICSDADNLHRIRVSLFHMNYNKRAAYHCGHSSSCRKIGTAHSQGTNYEEEEIHYVHTATKGL